MRACVWPARHFHPHLAERTEDRDLEGGRGDLHVGVGQLLDDQVSGEARVSGPALLESVEQVVGVAFHDQPDADHPAAAEKGGTRKLEQVTNPGPPKLVLLGKAPRGKQCGGDDQILPLLEVREELTSLM